MFRTNTIKSFSTRNRKQTKEVPTTKKVVNQNKKKFPGLKDAIGADQFTLKKENNGSISLTFTPQESVNFLDGNHTNPEWIDFDVTNTDYNDIVKNATGNETLNIYLEKLTLKQTNKYVNCVFIPTDSTSSSYVNKVVFTFLPDGGTAKTKQFNINNSIVSTLQVVNMASDATYITPIESANARFDSATLDDIIPEVTFNGQYEKAYLTNFRKKGGESQDKHYTQLVVKGDTKYWMELPKRSHPSGSSGTNDYWTVYSANEVVNTGILDGKIGIN